MTRKRASVSRGMLFAWGLLVGLAFLFLVPRDATGRLQHTYARVFRWPLATGRGLTQVARTTIREQTVSAADYQKLHQDYQRSRNDSANLQAQLREAGKQIERLTQLRALPGLEHMLPIPAGIVTQGKNELTINRGRDSGVAVGQCVMSFTDSRLNNQCVVGIVSSVYDDGAKVQLITDSKCRLPVRIGDLNVPIMMEGRDDGTARIPLLPHDKYQVNVHNAVYAERRKGFLDVPIIVGEVAQCGRDPDSPRTWDITVQPACDVTELNDVVVMKPASKP